MKVRADQTELQTVGTKINARGKCSLFFALSASILEVEFLIVSDSHLPNEVDALIGLDVIQRPGVELVKTKNYIDIRLTEAFVPTIASAAIARNNLSGMAESVREKLLELLANYERLTAPAIPTGELTVNLVDPIPVVHRSRRLAYAEHIRVKSLIEEMLLKGLIRESTSEYASPIVKNVQPTPTGAH